MPRLRPTLPALLATWAVALALALAAAVPVSAAGGQVEAEAALAEGLALIEKPDSLRDAIKTLKRADRLAHGGSFVARLALARCYGSLGQLDDQIGAAEKALAVAGTPPERVAAKRELAVGLARRSAGLRAAKRQRDLEAADTALREAIEEAGEHAPAILFYERAVVLLRLERDTEGVPLLLEYAHRAPEGELTARALSYAERPERARGEVVPDLELTTLDGDPITDESLEGKVVVIDFWATWCLPCRASLPTLKTLHELGEESGLLTVVSVSSETPETVRPFAEKEGMSWVLARDESGYAVKQGFDVRSLPTILLVDHQGRILSRQVGWGADSGPALVKEARKAIEDARKAADERRRST
ncbi:MAG TPA: redoxin domain-containing protein [Thermoanaerobaculia bacterium]|nr:redoxin domain-containing protein [Thermoanaerobaculia bacterium]